MQKLVFQHIFGHHFDELLHSIIDLAEALPARCVLVSAATKDLPSQNVHGAVALAAEGYLCFDLGTVGVRLLVRRHFVLAHKDGIVDILDLQRHVDYALHIAGLGVEAVHLLSVERDECGVVLGEELHLVVETIADESHPVRRIGVEYAVVDGILVDAGGKEHGNDIVHLRLAGVVGEIASVGHHAGIDARGELGRKNLFERQGHHPVTYRDGRVVLT